METASDTYQKHAKQQRDELVMANIDFVRHILAKIVTTLPDGVDAENLEAAGLLGLVEAAHQFDPERGVPFRAFAHRRIRGAIIDELRRNCPIPQQMLQMIAKINKACETLEPPVTPEGLARETQLTVNQVLSCLEAIRLTRPGIWDESLSPAGQESYFRRPESEMALDETKRLLSECIENLPKQERVVLTLYHMEDLRLREIGKVLGLSESRISRILASAQFRLKELMRVREGDT